MTAKKEKQEQVQPEQEQEELQQEKKQDTQQNIEQNLEHVDQGEQQSVKQEELVITPLQEEVIDNELAERLAKLEHWKPVTALGRAVKQGAVRNIDEILKQGKIILEPEIVDALLDLKAELLLIG